MANKARNMVELDHFYLLVWNPIQYPKMFETPENKQHVLKKSSRKKIHSIRNFLLKYSDLFG